MIEPRTPIKTGRGCGASRVLAVLVLLAVFGVVRPVVAQDQVDLQITSRYYIVIDADTGEIFAQRGAHDQVAIASLTKIYTAIQAIEEAPPNAEVTTTADDLVPGDATQVGFGPGETFTVDELIYGMMLPSGNDAARALARSLGAAPGDTAEQAIARFITRTNQRIRDMGLDETNLVTPDGWGVPGHVSSAYDLAAFTRYALQYPRFVDAISTVTYRTENGYVLTNTNRMLDLYNGIIGGKTGYDNDAGWCLVEVAERNGATMISVTLDGVAPNDWYDDNRVLLDYAFDQRAARRATGLGVIGEIAAYKDPDAAVIGRGAQAGASLSESGPLAEPTVTGGLGLIAPPGAAPTPAALIGADARSRRQLLAALGVAAAVILGGAFSAFRRAPRPREAATTSLIVASPPIASIAAGDAAPAEAASS